MKTDQATVNALKKGVAALENAEDERSRSLLRTVIDIIPAHICAKNREGRFLLVNKTLTDFYDTTVDEMTGVLHADICEDEEELRSMLAADRQVIESGHPIIIPEESMSNPDGTITFLETHKIPFTIFNESAVLIVGMDISKRREAESALRINEARQKKMLANIGDVIVIIDEKGINRYKSPNIEKLFGWKPEEVIGTCAFENVHPDDLMPAQQFFEKILSKPGASGSIVCRYKRKDGVYRWIEFTGTNLFHDPEISGLLGNYHDITERKWSENALRESELRFKALHNASFGGIALHDKGIIIDCNKGLSDLSGYSTEELIGMDGLLLIAEKSRNTVMKNILSGYEKPYEEWGLRKNGEEFPMRLEARNVPYKGKTIRTVEFRDISESKQAEVEREKLHAQLNQAQKMESVGRLAGGVAHDFNNMLAVILGHAEMALEQIAGTELLDTDRNSRDLIYNDLEEIRKAAERSADLTRQLLGFARKQTINLTIMDLNHTVAGMLKMLSRLIGEAIELVWLPADSLWPVKMDPNQVNQILANLCVNARDAIIGGGKIIIRTENITVKAADYPARNLLLPGEYVLLSVIDDGCGMDETILENIFEPFFTTKGLGEGTGLGLATVYGIVKQNHGFIDVSSRPGKGTVVNIYLPGQLASIVCGEKESANKIDSCGKETLLLIEDEPATLRMVKMMLERLGYNVLASTRPQEALVWAKNYRRIDLLISDLIMPHMNGRELADKILKHQPRIRILFMSGYSADVIFHEGIVEDGIQLIQKPFTKHLLAEKVREVLELEF